MRLYGAGKGILDFAVLAERSDTARYNCPRFPEADVWDLVAPRNCPPAEKESI